MIPHDLRYPIDAYIADAMPTHSLLTFSHFTLPRVAIVLDLAGYGPPVDAQSDQGPASDRLA